MSGSTARSASDSPWIHSRSFDLGFLTLSAALVFLPYLTYGLLQRAGVSVGAASLTVGLAVTLLVGGPHMYSTYLRTALEPSFRSRYGRIALVPLFVIPGIVIAGSIYAFPLLLTFFFFWASVHVVHQAQYISEAYRRKTQEVTTTDRVLDAAVILGALYTIAMFKFVDGRFVLGTQALLFPAFLKRAWVPATFAAGFAGVLTIYIVRTVSEIRRGIASWPRLVFMGLTLSMAFLVPLFDNLDVSFQGFNTWHSFQYLALTWFILSERARRNQVSSETVRQLARSRRPLRFYLAMIGVTIGSGAIYLLLWKGFGFPQDQCYYVVVLSFLLIHYFYDHLLFQDFTDPLPQVRPA